MPKRTVLYPVVIMTHDHMFWLQVGSFHQDGPYKPSVRSIHFGSLIAGIYYQAALLMNLSRSARVVLLLVGADLEAENLLAPWCLPGGGVGVPFFSPPKRSHPLSSIL